MKIDAGRKRKYGDERLSERVIFYVTKRQLDSLKDVSGNDVSSYIRGKIFSEGSGPVVVPDNAINEPKMTPVGHQLSAPTRRKFEDLAAEMGYEDVETLIGELLIIAASDIDGTRALMTGEPRDTSTEPLEAQRKVA